MNYDLLHIDKGEIFTDLTEVLRHLHGKDEEMNDHAQDLSTSLMKKCLELMEPKAAFISKEAIRIKDNIEIAIPETRLKAGGAIAKMLKGAEQYYFFIATAGPGPEELARSLIQEGQYLEGYIVDLIASSLVEATAQFVHDRIGEKAQKAGHRITNRYSPGYCGWGVDEQQKLFSLFPGGCCGITLSDSCLMYPIKSLSGVVGAGPGVSFRDYTCELCSMKDCSFRRTRATQGSISS